jgi:malonyl-CoA O-methyltransferase
MKDNFNRHASTYDRYATVQAEMAEALCNALVKTGKPFSSVFEAGCGTGLFSRLVLEKLRPQTLCLNDISHAMLDQIRGGTRHIQGVRITYREGDVEESDPGRDYDLFAANAVFQWIRDLGALFARIRSCLKPGGTLGFNLFLPGTFQELKESMIKAFDSPGLNAEKSMLGFAGEGEVMHLLAKNGFRTLSAFTQDHVPLYRHPRDFLKSLKKIGAAHFTGSQLPVKIMRRIMEHYTGAFADAQGLVPATYRVLYCVAEKE